MSEETVRAVTESGQEYDLEIVHRRGQLIVFRPGDSIEICRINQDSSFSWFPGTIEEKVGDHFLVEFNPSTTGENVEENKKTKVYVGDSLIRPPPPDFGGTPHYVQFGLVDAMVDGAWCLGTVSAVLGDSHYLVYIVHLNQSMQFQRPQLRHHLDWMNGMWCRVVQTIEITSIRVKFQLDWRNGLWIQLPKE